MLVKAEEGCMSEVGVKIDEGWKIGDVILADEQQLIYTLWKKSMEKNYGVSCSFCLTPKGEIRTILRLIFRQLATMLHDKRYTDANPSAQQNNGAIGRLVRIIFDQHQFELKMSKGCPHLKLRSLLKDKLKCRSDQLEIMLEDLCDRVARRNYQLQIIASQIKNVENSINQLDNPSSPEPSRRQNQEELVFREEEKEVKEEGKVKVEEDVEPVKNMNEGSPSTVIPYMSSSFGEMPFSYNFLFYGPYYQ